MNILGTGLEVVDQKKWCSEVQSYGDHFFVDFFSKREIQYCQRKKYPHEHFSARWACKMAVLRSLRQPHDLKLMRAIEILPDRRGCPRVRLSSSFFRLKLENGNLDVKVSLTHTKSFSAAEAVVVREGGRRS